MSQEDIYLSRRVPIVNDYLQVWNNLEQLRELIPAGPFRTPVSYVQSFSPVGGESKAGIGHGQQEFFALPDLPLDYDWTDWNHSLEAIGAITPTDQQIWGLP